MAHRPATLSDQFRNRSNLVDAHKETWRPPLHAAQTSRLAFGAAALRRAFDLQTGSAWRDIAPELRREHGTVIDVGCGSQPYRHLLPADATYVGIDTADALAHFGYQAPDTRYFEGDVWPVDDATADTVLATETLEHVLEPAVFLREAFRCSKPGARLLLTVPFSARWHFVPHDYWRFTPSSLRHLLEEAGYESIAVYARGNRVTVAAYKLMALALPLFFARGKSTAAAAVSLLGGLLCFPVILVCAGVAHVSLRFDGGDDCLGYTVLARRPTS